ncbi:MAG: dockerin type I domain-containing protein [Candidatus Zixiibacteriota bacterium]
MNLYIAKTNRIFGLAVLVTLLFFVVGSQLMAAEISCDTPPAGCRGDINLNGIAFEIADMLIFQNYFTVGITAFTINIEAQIAATDINMDGLPLSVADYVMLVRICQGDIPPDFDPTDTLSGVIYSGTAGSVNEIGSNFSGEIGTLTLTFEAVNITGYNIILLPETEGMTLSHQLIAGVLTVTLEATIDASISDGQNQLYQIEYTGDDLILNNISAVGMFGNPVKASISDDILLGDINLNSVSYEIADVVLFTNYIVYGDTILHLNYILQSLNSDVNEDGEQLTLADYQYLLGVVIGAFPAGTPVGPAISGELAAESYTTGGTDWTKFISGLENSIGALKIELLTSGTTSYTINPLPAISEMGLTYESFGDTLRILITRDMASPGAISAGINELFTLNFEGTQPVLISAEMGGTGGQSVNAAAEPCGYYLGDANGNETINILDVVYIIEYLYKSGPEPVSSPIRSADVDCNCTINILDITGIISYLYKSGQAPCSCTQWMYNCSGWE